MKTMLTVEMNRVSALNEMLNGMIKSYETNKDINTCEDLEFSKTLIKNQAFALMNELSILTKII